MSETERVLEALLIQLQFELAQAGATLSQARLLSARAKALYQAQQLRCETVAAQWRAGVEQPFINPALLDLLRRLLSNEAGATRVLDAQRLEALRDEAQAYAALSAAHRRTLAMERLLLAERRRLKQQQQTQEFNRNDNLWLQHVMRTSA